MNTLMLQFRKVISLCLIVCAFGCFAPQTQAVVPPPDGAYPNFTTAEGQNALKDLTTGAANTALGAFSLFANTTGSFNTAVGAGALDLNTGDQNTAVGVAALLLNTGTNNTAIGVDALGLNTAGESNAAVGSFALYNNTTGGSNIAIGYNSLFNNTTGVSNVAIGFQTLLFNTIGSSNIALGDEAGSNIVTGNNNIDIGGGGAVDESNTIRIGNPFTSATYIAGINGATASGGTAVFIDANGQLGTLTSSARFKDNIKPMNKASESILALKPVTFRYKKEIDANGIPQFGLVAEEVAKVNPELVITDRAGKPYTVRYDAVNAMLLNEFLKEHRKVEQMQKQIDALTAGLQKVSAQLELSKAAPQTVLNGQ